MIFQDLPSKIECSTSFVDKMQIISCFSAEVTIAWFPIFDDVWVLTRKLWNGVIFLTNCKHFLIIWSCKSYKANMMISPSYVIQRFLHQGFNSMVITYHCASERTYILPPYLSCSQNIIWWEIKNYSIYKKIKIKLWIGYCIRSYWQEI